MSFAIRKHTKTIRAVVAAFTLFNSSAVLAESGGNVMSPAMKEKVKIETYDDAVTFFNTLSAKVDGKKLISSDDIDLATKATKIISDRLADSSSKVGIMELNRLNALVNHLSSRNAELSDILRPLAVSISEQQKAQGVVPLGGGFAMDLSDVVPTPREPIREAPSVTGLETILVTIPARVKPLQQTGEIQPVALETAAFYGLDVYPEFTSDVAAGVFFEKNGDKAGAVRTGTSIADHLSDIDAAGNDRIRNELGSQYNTFMKNLKAGKIEEALNMLPESSSLRQAVGSAFENRTFWSPKSGSVLVASGQVGFTIAVESCMDQLREYYNSEDASKVLSFCVTRIGAYVNAAALFAREEELKLLGGAATGQTRSANQFLFTKFGLSTESSFGINPDFSVVLNASLELEPGQGGDTGAKSTGAQGTLWITPVLKDRNHGGADVLEHPVAGFRIEGVGLRGAERGELFALSFGVSYSSDKIPKLKEKLGPVKIRVYLVPVVAIREKDYTSAVDVTKLFEGKSEGITLAGGAATRAVVSIPLNELTRLDIAPNVSMMNDIRLIGVGANYTVSKDDYGRGYSIGVNAARIMGGVESPTLQGAKTVMGTLEWRF